MWIFLIVPFITAFLYYSYALRPITSLNITEHKITLVNEEILVDMIVHEKSAKEKTGNKGKVEEKAVKDEIGKKPDKRRIVISKSLLRQTRISGNDIIFIFGKTAKEFLVIPYAAFSDQKDIESVLQKSDLEFNKNW